MADYRDPKVTTTGSARSRGMSTWIGIVIAALVIIALIWWWWGAGVDETVVAPTTGTVTEQPVTEEPATTAPAQPAQQ
jgi:hypothetical protein